MLFELQVNLSPSFGCCCLNFRFIPMENLSLKHFWSKASHYFLYVEKRNSVVLKSLKWLLPCFLSLTFLFKQMQNGLFCVYSSDLVGGSWLADWNLKCSVCGRHSSMLVKAVSALCVKFAFLSSLVSSLWERPPYLVHFFFLKMDVWEWLGCSGDTWQCNPGVTHLITAGIGSSRS